MKSLVQFLNENQSFIVNKHTSKVYNYHPKTRDELKELINKLIKERGNKADLNYIDTSAIIDMCGLFIGSNFNGDISSWDVSNVKYTQYMFSFSNFDGNISNWNVSNVKDMKDMFANSPLENNPPKWYKK